ncbi:MAG: VWA domain-containing protein, partial [Pseudomonadota bacterium]|nr:VWA domain-containing protein [Pseudomonadota bacterium]
MPARTVWLTTWLTGFITLLLWPLAGLAAPGPLSQVPILNAATTKSNILIILDDSGSMGWGSGPPMEDAKTASIALLDTLSNVRVGVGSFHSTNFWAGNTGLELDHMIVDLDANRSSIYKAINDLRASGGTPLINSLQEAGRYFVGTRGPANPGNSSSSSCTANGKYEGKLTLKPGRTGEKKWKVNEVFPRKALNGDSVGSPLCHWCQQNFVILLTDGYEWGSTLSEPLEGRYCPYVDSNNQGCWHGLISAAKALNEVDLRPDIDNFKGEEVTNNVVTYTVGFHTSQSLLADTAKEGGGLYVEADDEASLKAAFAKIGEDILAHTKGSSASPSFNTPSLKGNTLVYLTRFDSEYWTGDVMAAPFSEAGVVGPQKWSAADLLDNNKSP